MVDQAKLESFDLLRCVNGRWKYRYAVGASWMTANSLEDAIGMATKAYNDAEPNTLLTHEEKSERADAAEHEHMARAYGHLSDDDLQKMIDKLGKRVDSLQQAGRREFNGNGGRRTGAAVSNEAARDVATEKQRLERFLRERSLVKRAAK